MTKKLILSILFFTFMFAGTTVFADDECAATLDIEQGKIEMPCVIGIIEGEEIAGVYYISLEHNGNSMNWKIKDVSLVETEIAESADEDSCGPILVEINSGEIQISMPCLIFDDELYEVHMISQRGHSHNLELDVIKKNGDVLYSKNKNKGKKDKSG